MLKFLAVAAFAAAAITGACVKRKVAVPTRSKRDLEVDAGTDIGRVWDLYPGADVATVH